jgi:hypothetical protein
MLQMDLHWPSEWEIGSFDRQSPAVVQTHAEMHAICQSIIKQGGALLKSPHLLEELVNGLLTWIMFTMCHVAKVILAQSH